MSQDNEFELLTSNSQDSGLQNNCKPVNCQPALTCDPNNPCIPSGMDDKELNLAINLSKPSDKCMPDASCDPFTKCQPRNPDEEKSHALSTKMNLLHVECLTKSKNEEQASGHCKPEKNWRDPNKGVLL